MDPQSFIRLSIGSLGLRAPSPFPSPCTCEIRLRGFPVQTAQVPFISSPAETNPNSQSSFYLNESHLKALSPSQHCFHNSTTYLEIVILAKRRRVGTFKLGVGPEWGEGKPIVIFNGWTFIGKKSRGELHLRVSLDPDPRYVFQFEGVTKSSPQIVQLQGAVKQPIFSCKFSRDSSYQETECRERRGWKVSIHGLSGSAIAAALITTPFVPSNGCDWVGKSSPGAWLIVHPDPGRPASWQPWGRLEAWRERRGGGDFVCFRFNLLWDEGKLLASEMCEGGGEFRVDTDCREGVEGREVGFVMSCRVGECGKVVVHLAMRHVVCVEDAAIFMALGAAVDLSVEACGLFGRRRRSRNLCWW